MQQPLTPVENKSLCSEDTHTSAEQVQRALTPVKNKCSWSCRSRPFFPGESHSVRAVAARSRRRLSHAREPSHARSSTRSIARADLALVSSGGGGVVHGTHACPARRMWHSRQDSGRRVRARASESSAALHAAAAKGRRHHNAAFVCLAGEKNDAGFGFALAATI